MNIVRHADIERDFRALKRFVTPRESLDAWELLFCSKGISETPGVNPFPGFGMRKIFKARVVALKENFGKSKGYRVVFEMINDSCTILVFSRHGIYHDEQDLISVVKSRLNT